MNEKQWEKTIAEWEKAEISQAEWCRQKKLHPNQFSYWKVSV